MSAPLIALEDLVALSLIPGLSRRRLVSAVVDGTMPFEAVVEFANRSRDVPGRVSAARRAAEQALTRARLAGIETVVLGSPRYPWLLAQIPDAPLVLWTRGDVAALSEPLVAIVGSRAASPYGEGIARQLAADLCGRGFAIASGLARGIDAAAHRGVLDAAGRTVAVLGCGADVAYPREHAQLRDEILGCGAVISEFPAGTPPCPAHFPMRNRIISGLSLGVVVVEAPRRSGALITADFALDQGREVMAVPGSVFGERHRGSHRLLKEGAALVETADDVLDAVGLFGACVVEPATARGTQGDLLATIGLGEGADLDAIAAASGSDAARLLPVLLELELKGLVRRLPGGRFVRSGGTC